jgi:hypothetical protein
MLFGSQGEGINVNTFIRVASVGLVRLDPREVSAFTFRESILTVQLELGSDDRVLAPAVHIQRGFSEDESTSIRDTSVGKVVIYSTRNDTSGKGGSTKRDLVTAKVDFVVGVGRTVPVTSETSSGLVIHSTSIIEKTVGINEGTRIFSNRSRTSESVDSVRKSINGISVVEGLSTKDLEKESIASQRRAIVNVLIGLDDPDKLLNGVVKVELDLVTGRTNRLITSELELSDKVFVGILCHSSALVSVKEDIVDVEGSSNQRLIVGDGGRDGATSGVLVSSVESRTRAAVQGGDSPQALINRADIKINLDFVVLESNQGKCKTRVGAEPELKRNVKSGLRKSIAGSANLTRSQGVARGFNIRERGISDEGKLGGVTNHLEVSTLLLRSHSELIPDVHPVTILAIDSLTTNLNLNLSDKLLAGVIQPTGIDTSVLAAGVVSKTHKLVDLG